MRVWSPGPGRGTQGRRGQRAGRGREAGESGPPPRGRAEQVPGPRTTGRATCRPGSRPARKNRSGRRGPGAFRRRGRAATRLKGAAALAAAARTHRRASRGRGQRGRAAGTAGLAGARRARSVGRGWVRLPRSPCVSGSRGARPGSRAAGLFSPQRGGRGSRAGFSGSYNSSTVL